MALPIKPLPVPFLLYFIVTVLELVFLLKLFVCANGTIRGVGRGAVDGKICMEGARRGRVEGRGEDGGSGRHKEREVVMSQRKCGVVFKYGKK